MQTMIGVLRHSRRLRLPIEILFLALLYIVAARLGMLFFQSQGLAPIFWPAAGVALAGVVLGGYVFSLSVFIGALVVGVMTLGGPDVAPFIPLTVQAIGSVAQALLGAYLLRRFVSPLPPTTIRATLRAIGLCALTSGIAPLIGVLAFSFTDYISLNQALIAAFRWWVGILVGILMTVPGLIALGQFWRRRSSSEWLLWPIASLMIGLAFLSFVVAVREEDRQLNARLNADATEMIHSIEHLLADNEYLLLTTNAYLAASEEVRQDEFARFAAPLLQHSQTTVALAWAPRVPADQRAAFEQTRRVAGQVDFMIVERDTAGNIIPAAARAEYYPITYFESRTIEAAPFGFDMASEPQRRAALARARESADSQLTSPLPPVAANMDARHILLVRPVYDLDAPMEASTDSQSNLLGFVVLVQEANILADHAITHINQRDISFYLFDVTDEPAQVLAIRPALTSAAAEPAVITPDLLGQMSSYAVDTARFGRSWRAVVNPSAAYIAEVRGRISWLSLLLGLATATVFLFYMRSRKLAEQQLRAVESRYRLIAENAADVIWMLDLQAQRFTYVSPSVTKLLGYTTDEILRRSMIDVLTPESLEKVQTWMATNPPHPGAPPVSSALDQVRKNGSVVPTEVITSYGLDERGRLQLIGVARDITERKADETRLWKLNRAYMVLSEVNDAIVRVHDRQELFSQACQIAVERGEFRMAWIGLVRADRKRVDCVAAAGETGDYLARLNITLDESDRRHGPSATAIRDGNPVMISDIASDPRFAPWRADALHYGYRSMTAFPLIVAGVTRGVLNLYSAEPNFFDEAELKLFAEMANNISFALEFIEQEQLREAAEEHLRVSERRSRMLLNAIPDMMFRISADGRFLDYSAKDNSKLYAPPEQFIGKPFREVLPPALADLWHGVIQQAFATEMPQTIDYTLEIGGAPRVFEARLVVNTSEQEVVAILRDVTEARRAVAEITQLSRVVEQMDDVVLITGIDGAIEYVNPAFERQYGYSAAEAIGRNPRILKSDLESPEFYQRLWTTILSGESFQAEVRNRRKNGELIHEALTITPIRDEHGVIRRFVATGKDITARKQMEHDLQERLKELTCLRQVQHLLEQDPSVDEVCHQVPLLLTPALQFPQDAAARIVIDRYCDSHLNMMAMPKRVLTAEIMVGGSVQGRLCVGYRADHPFVIPEEQLMLNSIAHTLGLWLERRQAQEELTHERNSLARRVAERTADLSRANQELARAVRAKDDFLTNMSHELRTPLNAILALSEGLIEQVRGPLNERQMRSIHNIETSGRHLLSLINDILDLSKVEAGQMELQREIVVIQDICEASLLFIKEQASKKQLRVGFTLNDEHSSVMADPKRLKQILVNLLSNAVKFTPAGGSVELAVDADPDAGLIRFVVRDTGIGITPEGMARLFQPFIQLDSGLSRQHEGTGLGLALVRRLAEMHGGSVSVESEPDHGSCFTVVLPYTPHRAASVAPSAEVLETNAHAAFHAALIIEDSESAGEQLARYLEELNIRAVVHSRAGDALERAAAIRPDIIFLDLQMPDQSGWDVLARLKADPILHAIPVIIVSVVDDRKHGAEAGAAGYLVKPISRELVRRALAAVVALPNELAVTGSIAPQSVAASPAPRILMAEDNEVNIIAVGDYLQDRGYQVVIARNGREALLLAEETKPDLILMDIQMPEIDGLEVIRRLRATVAFVTVPIIALTALAMPGDRERCLAAGASAYVTKPVSPRGLVQTIERLLKHV